jgi:hypothetical protein
MPETSRHDIGRGMSRRSLFKGGLTLAAGAVATLLAAQAGSAAITPMDVARVQPVPAVTETTGTTATTSTTTVGWAPAPTTQSVIPSFWFVPTTSSVTE